MANEARAYGATTRALHWATVLALFVALAAHVGLVLRRGLLPRML